MQKIILILSLFLFTACNEQSKTVIDAPSKIHKNLDKNKKLWENTNIKHYSFVVKRSCFCPREENRHITIQNGKVTKAKYIPSNTPLPKTTKVKKIEDYFDIIENALAKNAYQITVSYDKTYGYPSDIAIDYDKQMADEEIYYAITHFQKGNDNVVCTAEYMPVCAKVVAQCVTTPCEAIEKTFSNKCRLNANPNATYLRDGECQ